MAFMLHPGVYSQEIDLSQRVAAAASSTGAAVFASKMGPLGPSFYTNRDDFMKVYGKPDPSVSFGHDCVIDFLSQANAIWVNRVHNGAAWAGLTFLNNKDTSPTATVKRTFIDGANSDYTAGGRQIQTITFSTALVSLNSIGVTTLTSGSSTQATSAVVFATDSDTTMEAYIVALQGALDSIATGGLVEAVETTNILNIRVISPENTRVVITAPTVTLGASQPTVTVQQISKLFDIFAENPGAWGNRVGVKITNIDKGTPQRLKLTFSGALVTGNSFTCNVNGTALSAPVTFSTDSDTTMAAIAAAIKTALDTTTSKTTGSATVISVPNSVSNDRQILVIAPDAKADITITGAAITSGASQATVTVAETLKRIAPNNTFALEVYTADNVNVPVETFTVSTGLQMDGLGYQQNIAQVVNEASTKSKYIRVYQPTAAVGVDILTEDSVSAGPTWLTGGDDGAAVADSHIIQGWDAFKNRNKFEVRILINCGYTSVSVQQKMTALAESRKDCFAILDLPSDRQAATDAVAYRKEELNINSSYAALYGPDLKIADEFSDVIRFIPPSGKIAATFAYTDRTRNVWWSPAGLNRGQIREIIGLRVDYDEGMLDLLSPSQVNAIVKKPGAGYVAWDDQTLQSMKSALSNINVRRLLIAIEVAVTDALDYSVFDPNDDFTRFSIVQMINNFLEPIRTGRGLYSYLVVSDETNNPSYLIDAGQLNVDVYLQPTLPARTILLSSILTKTGASFQELVQKGGSTGLV